MTYMTCDELAQAPTGTRVVDQDGLHWERIAKTDPRAKWAQHLATPWTGVPATKGGMYWAEVMGSAELARYRVREA